MLLGSFVACLFGLNSRFELSDIGSTLALSCLSFSFIKAAIPVFHHWFHVGGSLFTIVGAAVRFGGHMAALKIMERHTDDPGDAADFLTILQTMTCNEMDLSYLVKELGGIDITVSTMKKFATDYEGVACSGCGLLMNICGYSDETDEKVMYSGGISVLVNAMRAWPEDERTQCFACTALAKLAGSPNQTIKKKIIDAGGLIALAEARTKHQNDIRVRKPAAHALTELVDW
jgi:hypothetical protein